MISTPRQGSPNSTLGKRKAYHQNAAVFVAVLARGVWTSGRLTAMFADRRTIVHPLRIPEHGCTTQTGPSALGGMGMGMGMIVASIIIVW